MSRNVYNPLSFPVPMRTLCLALALLIAAPAAAQDMGALFRQGMEAVEAGEHDKAIAAFREMLVADPSLVRVRLELARAFYLKGEDRLAKRHFERVLAGGVPPPVIANVRRFLAEIRARRRWTMHAGFALAPDTNIGATSDERIIYIDVGGQRLPFERDAEDLTSSGIGLSVWTGGEYQYPLAPRWRLRAGGNLSRREYEGSRFDHTFASLHGGPRWLIHQGTEASLLASVGRRWAATTPDHDDIGLRLEGAHRLTRRVTMRGRASWRDRSYRTRDYLDGPAVDVSLSGSWVVRPTVRVHAGIGWGDERPKAERWRQERRWLRLGASVALPRGFTVGATGEARRASYEGNWFPHTAGDARKDRTGSIRLSAHNRALAWRGFSPQLSIVHERRRTNAQLYDYERTGGELRFVRVF